MSDVLADSSFRRDRTRAADQVLNDLRLQILSGRLARGTRLPSEKELAAHYDVSSPTVRESLRALSAMSLVEIRHGSGTFVIAETARLLSAAMAAVVQLERVDILGILDVSEALFSTAMRLGVSAATDADLSELRAAAGRFEPDSGGADFAGALNDFLKALVGVSHNPLLIGMSGFLIDTQIALAQDSGRRSPALWQRIAGELIGERKAILEALEARDSDAAEATVVTYTQRARELVRENLGEGTQ